MVKRFVPAVLSAALAGTGLLLGAAPASATLGSAPHPPLPHVATGGGVFEQYHPGASAVRYDPELIPERAKAGVFSVSSHHHGTKTALGVAGLVPNREYGAHVHTKPCGATGEAAGPHFQHKQDPVKPSVDPRYANPDNEIWLDFTTDRFGHGFAKSRVDWRFDERRAKSVVIHETHTHTDPGNAGDAGSRLACINVDF